MGRKYDDAEWAQSIEIPPLHFVMVGMEKENEVGLALANVIARGIPPH